MLKKSLLILMVSLIVLSVICPINADAKDSPDNKNSLVILWTSGNRDVALKMVFMYATNSKLWGWWDKVTIIVWGPSAKLLSEDKELQEKIIKLKTEKVIVEACKSCADQYNVSAKLQSLGIDVKYMGEPLTNYIKQGHYVLTF